jgi:DNA polymerase (family 10)
MAKLDASAVAALLIEIGRRLVLAGENPYKARAYSRAAQNLLTLTLPLGEVLAGGRLREIPGVGEALAATIEQLYARGTTPKLEALRADAPAGVLEMLRIPGLSPQKVRQIHQALGIENLADLESACRDGRVRTAKGRTWARDEDLERDRASATVRRAAPDTSRGPTSRSSRIQFEAIAS